MLFGRMLGWIVVIGGAVLLQRHDSAWAGLGRWTEGAAAWNVAGEAPLDYIAQSLGESFSAVLFSGRIAPVLILLGVLMAWVCRRGPRYG